MIGQTESVTFGPSIMLFEPQRNPKKKAVVRLAKQGRHGDPKPNLVIFSDVVPIGMKGIRISVLSGAEPWIQNAGSRLRLCGTDVEERFADVEDALQPNSERTDLGDIVLLRSANGLVQGLTILVRKRPVIRHQKCGAAK